MNTRPSMQKASRFVLLGIGLSLILTQFINCGSYQAADSTLDGASAVACTNTSCTLANTDNMSITPHVANGEYAVPAGLSEFNLGGDCNEGGFLAPPAGTPANSLGTASNYIHWDLVDPSGAIVRSSAMQIAAGLNMESKCINGRFLIYVILSPITLNNADPYDRTGLALPNGTRSAYNLHITIFGVDPTTGAQGQATTNIPLSAI
jgi:hypothetical protein